MRRGRLVIDHRAARAKIDEQQHRLNTGNDVIRRTSCISGQWSYIRTTHIDTHTDTHTHTHTHGWQNDGDKTRARM